MKFVALIPARGGSRRIPRKNLQLVGGMTLVERAIACAQAAKIIDAVYVSTEDDEISALALAAGAGVIRRPVYLAANDTPMEDVVEDFLLGAGLEDDDVVVLLEPTAPLRTPEDIYSVAAVMLSTYAPAARIVHGEGGGFRYTDAGCHGFRYTDAGLASAIRVGAFGRCLFPRGTLLLHIGDERAIDVDEVADLERVRALA